MKIDSPEKEGDRNNMKKNEELLEHASFGKLVLNLCVPSIIIMLVMVIYNMADTFFIGQTGDPNKIAAISLCNPLFTVLSGLGTLFGSGGCTAISIALGKRDFENIRHYTSFCCYAGLALGFLFSGIVLSCTPAICMALWADADTLGFTCNYLRIIAIGAPFIMFTHIFANIIRADGAAFQSMIANGLGTVSNIVMDAIFIMIFHWDVRGAALATILGNILSCLYLFYYVTRKQKAFSLSLKYFSLRKDISFAILSLGLPMACSTLLMSFSHVIANRMMVGYSAVALAAQGVAGKCSMLISMLAMGICMGIQPAISFSYGRRNLERMKLLIRNTGIVTFLIGTVLSILGMVFRDTLIALFIQNDDVIAYGQIMIIANLITGPFYGLYQLCQSFLQSTGKASYATFTAFLDKGLYYLPILFLMEHFFGMYGIAFTGAVTLFFSLITGALLSFRWNRQIAAQ